MQKENSQNFGKFLKLHFSNEVSQNFPFEKATLQKHSKQETLV
jgi:hypothetical protein